MKTIETTEPAGRIALARISELSLDELEAITARHPRLCADVMQGYDRENQSLRDALEALLDGVATPESNHPWAIKQREAHEKARAALKGAA
jgi:hypothetical protein